MASQKIARDEKAWELEVRAEIAPEKLDEHRAHVLADAKKTVQLPGFRPGKAPESTVIKAIGEPEILRRTIEHAIQHELPEILAGENVNIIAAPKVVVESAPKAFPASEPVVFLARAPLQPEVKLPNYKTIAKKHSETKSDIVVSEEEHTQTMTHLRRERARITKVELGLSPQEAAQQAQSATEKDLPALDDEFVKSLGYESLEKFSDAVRGNIKTEKEMQAAEKRRAALLDELIEKSSIKYPAILREYEVDDMEARLKQDLERMHMPFDAYLNEVKKTREELRTEWEPAADKRAKMRLILSHIAIAEKIDADPERLEREIKNAKQHYPNADETNLRAHISHALRNEAVISFLEQQQ